MAPVVKALKERRDITLTVCVTAQHRSMLDQVLSVFKIDPDIDLNIMQPGQTLSDITAKVLVEVGKVLTSVKPDWVLVHGDTTTAMAATVAAFYQKIPIGHVEAGLRTGNLSQPWPEEMNRQVIDLMTNLFFAPTEDAKSNLINEGVCEQKILLTGNTVVDALLGVVQRLTDETQFSDQFDSEFDFLDKKRKMVLVTGHRRESFGSGFENLCEALRRLAYQGNSQIVFPLHLNENVRRPVHRLLSNVNDIHLLEPQEYLPFIYLLNRCDLVITDSGGIQEEAPSLGKPVLVTRDVTERPEAVRAGVAKLVGTSADKIFAEASELLSSYNEYQKMSEISNPYGDGDAASKIVQGLLSFE